MDLNNDITKIESLWFHFKRYHYNKLYTLAAYFVHSE